MNSLDIDTVINAQNVVYGTAIDLDPAAGRNQPIRPVLDGSFITVPLDSTGAFPSQNKPLLLTTVSHEAAYAIYKSFPALPEEAFPPICAATFGPDRTDVVINAPFYAPVPSAIDGSVDARVQLQNVGTDYLWKCSSWTFARSWVQHGGSAFVGQYVVGASYPGNEAVPYCSTPGVLCHQDDILIVVCIFLFSSHIRLCFLLHMAILLVLVGFVFISSHLVLPLPINLVSFLQHQAHILIEVSLYSSAQPPTQRAPNPLSPPRCNNVTGPSLQLVIPTPRVCLPGQLQPLPMFTPSCLAGRARRLSVLVTQTSGVRVCSMITSSSTSKLSARLLNGPCLGLVTFIRTSRCKPGVSKLHQASFSSSCRKPPLLIHSLLDPSVLSPNSHR